MAHYLVQGSYVPASIKAMVEKSEDRSNAVRALMQSVGGTLHHMFFSLGDSDFYILCELPDNVAAAAIAMAVGAAGSLSSYRTTALLTPAEAVQAMSKAKGITYTPPGKTS